MCVCVCVSTSIKKTFTRCNRNQKKNGAKRLEKHFRFTLLSSPTTYFSFVCALVNVCNCFEIAQTCRARDRVRKKNCLPSVQDSSTVQQSKRRPLQHNMTSASASCMLVCVRERIPHTSPK